MASTVRDRRKDGRSDSDTDEQNEKSSQQEGKGAGQQVKSSHIITEHIDVGVPHEEAFKRWTDYEKWSEIFKKESADPESRSRSQQRVKVRAKIGPSERQWTAEVTSTEPGHRIRWESKGPLQAKGATNFHRLDDRLTRIMVEVEYDPKGFLEVLGNFFRMQRRRVRRDLRMFKNYVELEQAAGEGHNEQGSDDEQGSGDKRGDDGKEQ